MKAYKLGMVVAEFNYEVTSLMMERAKAEADFLGVEIVRTVKVPGVFEVPMATKKLLQMDDIDAVITLGAVITGETRDAMSSTPSSRCSRDWTSENTITPGQPGTFSYIVGDGGGGPQPRRRGGKQTQQLTSWASDRHTPRILSSLSRGTGRCRSSWRCEHNLLRPCRGL